MSHLRVVIDGHDVVLPQDASIDITDRNPYFNDGIETYSYPFQLPIEGNRELFGCIEHVPDDTRLFAIEGKPMEIYIDNVLFRSGKVAPIEEQEIIDTISISMVSNKKQLKDLFGDLTLQDIPVPEEDQDDLQIGEMIGDVIADPTSQTDAYAMYSFKASVKVLNSSYKYFSNQQRIVSIKMTPDGYNKMQPIALTTSTNKEYSCEDTYPFKVRKDAEGELIVNKNFINTSAPYGDTIVHPDGTTRRALYHNARVCYTHYKLDKDKKTSEFVKFDKLEYGPYFVLDADRPQSGICFYLLYVLQALFKHLGVVYDDTELRKVEDMNHLSFFTTKCKYDLVRKYPNHGSTEEEKHYAADFPFHESFDKNGINDWLSDRKIDGELYAGKKEIETAKDIIEVPMYLRYYAFPPGTAEYYNNSVPGFKYFCDILDSGQYSAFTICVRPEEISKDVLSKTVPVERPLVNMMDGYEYADYELDNRIKFELDDITLFNHAIDEKATNLRYSASVMKMIANFKNLPDMSVSSFIESLWASFGIRFDYDSERNFVKAYFIRDLLQSNDTFYVHGDCLSVHKMNERITGVRMKYNNESSINDQNANIRNQITDYDTDYDYLVNRSQFIELRDSYADIAAMYRSIANTTCYVDLQTGNAFRIKINKDALQDQKYSELKPQFFQVATFKGITEYIDELKGRDEYDLVTDSDVEDYVHEISSDFVPLIQNDVNYAHPENAPLLCPFVNEKMWNEECKMNRPRTLFSSNYSYVAYVEEIIKTDERYDTDDSEDGNSPLQEYDWGNCITLMRGGGSDAHVDYYDYDYDGFGNAKFRMVSGQYQMDSDSISLNGDEYDYNGDLPGIGGLIINGSYNGTYTKEQAAALMREIWPSSNANLTSELRQVTAMQMREKGWSVEGDTICTVFSQTYALTDKDGIVKEYLVTPITDNGYIFTPDELTEYLRSLEQRAAQGVNGIMALDAMRYGVGGSRPGRRVIIQEFKDGVSDGNGYHSPFSDFYADVLHQLQAIYFLDATTVNATPPAGLIIEHNISFGLQERISLKIRAYHKDADGNILCSTQHGYRGLADRFMSEYIYFLLHRKKERFQLLPKVPYLITPQWLQRYSVEGITGWPNEMQTKVSVQSGIESVQFDLYVL